MPSSSIHLLGKSSWSRPLPNFILASTCGQVLVGHEFQRNEICRWLDWEMSWKIATENTWQKYTTKCLWRMAWDGLTEELTDTPKDTPYLFHAKIYLLIRITVTSNNCIEINSHSNNPRHITTIMSYTRIQLSNYELLSFIRCISTFQSARVVTAFVFREK